MRAVDMTEYVNFETANQYFIGGDDLNENVKKGEKTNLDNASRGGGAPVNLVKTGLVAFPYFCFIHK